MNRSYRDPSAGRIEGDTITTSVRYEHGREQFSEFLVNGLTVPDVAQLRGSWSEGEFGSFLRGIFSRQSSPELVFRRPALLQNARALVFDYQIPKDANHFWSLHVLGLPAENGGDRRRTIYPGIRGQLWVDQSNFHLLRLEMVATDVDKDFPMQDVKNVIEYAYTSMGDGTKTVLPTLSTSKVCPPKSLCQENQLRFLNCHKFGVDTRILPVLDSPELQR